MALKMNLNSDIGQEFIDAYFVITEYSCDKNENVHARIRAYVDREKYKQGCDYISGSEQVITLKCDYSEVAINPKKQIYNYMKTLDKYSESVDILE